MNDSEEIVVPPRAWRALAVASAGYVLFGFNSTATNLAFGSISETFADASEATLSWVASGFFIASAAFLPLGGRLADRIGRRRIFNLGLIGFVVSAVASAIAPSIEILIAARVAQAISGAFVIPSSLSVVLPEFPAKRRPSAVATWAAAGPLSAAVAPSAAAGVLGATSWRWVYAMSAPIALLVLGLSFLLIRESKSDEESTARLDLTGSVLAVASVALLIVGIGQGTNWGWTSVATNGTIVGALLLGGLFVLRSTRHPAPLVNISLFKVPEIAVANLANFFMSLTSLSVWLIWPLFLTRIWGYSIAKIGLAITIGPLFAGPSALLGGRLADRYGQRWLMIIGSGICTLAILWSVVRLGTEPDYLLGLMPTIAGFGFGWGMSNPSMNSWALANGPQASYGEVNAAFNTNRNLGAAIGSAAAIAIIGSDDRVDAISAYTRANIFFATAVGLSFLVVLIGATAVDRRRSAQNQLAATKIPAAELLKDLDDPAPVPTRAQPAPIPPMPGQQASAGAIVPTADRGHSRFDGSILQPGWPPPVRPELRRPPSILAQDPEPMPGPRRQPPAQPEPDGDPGVNADADADSGETKTSAAAAGVAALGVGAIALVVAAYRRQRPKT